MKKIIVCLIGVVCLYCTGLNAVELSAPPVLQDEPIAEQHYLREIYENILRLDLEILNVKNYGAKGDGSKDDTSAIQDAIDDISASGGIIFFPQGRYKITSALTYTTQRNVIFMGAGQGGWVSTTSDYGTSQLETDQDIYIFDFGSNTTHNNNGPLIENLTFKDTNATSVSAGGITGGAIRIRNMDRAKIINCSFNLFRAGYGIHFDSSGVGFQQPTIEECNFTQCKYSIYIGGDYGLVGSRIMGGFIQNSTGYTISGGKGITLKNCGHVKLRGILIETIETSISVEGASSSAYHTYDAVETGIATTGIHIAAGSYIRIRDPHIGTCTTGILIDSNANTFAISIINPYFASNTADITDNSTVAPLLSVLSGQGLRQTPKALANEATPSVSKGSTWLTGGTTTITDFDDGVTGQRITIIAEHSITITHGTNIFLNGSVNWAMIATDTLTLICKADNKWYEISRAARLSRCRAYLSAAAQTISTGTWTKVEFDGESYDYLNEFDSTTNYQFTATKAGLYLVCAKIEYGVTTANKTYYIAIYKNGGLAGHAPWQSAHTGSLGIMISNIIELAVNDYIEIRTYHDSGVDRNVSRGQSYSYVAIHQL